MITIKEDQCLRDDIITSDSATPAPAPAVPQGYGIHEIPADYSGLVWLEGQVRAVARLAQAATGPQGWTDADSDAARLALELECLLMDTKDLSVVSKWWASANDALELHRQRLGATPAPAPAVPQGWAFSVSDDDDGTWLRVKSPGGREAAFSAVNGGLAHDNRRSIASRVLLELKEALAATAPAPAQEVATLSLSAEDVHAAFAKNFPKSRISQAWINFAADIAQAIAARAAKPAQDVGLTDEEIDENTVWLDPDPHDNVHCDVSATVRKCLAALRAKEQA